MTISACCRSARRSHGSGIAGGCATMFVASIGWAVLNLLQLIGVDRQAQDVVAMGITAILAVMGIAIVWLRIAMQDEQPISRLVAVLLTTAIIAAGCSRRWGCRPCSGRVLVLSLAPLAAGIGADERPQRRAGGRSDRRRTPRVLTWAVVVERALRVGDRHRRRLGAGECLGRRSRPDRDGRDGLHAHAALGAAHRHRAAGRGPRLAADPRRPRRAARRRARRRARRLAGGAQAPAPAHPAADPAQLPDGADRLGQQC